MFTGIILEQGRVADRKGKSLKIRTPMRASRGESVAVNGACLTVTRRGAGILSFDVSQETFRLTNLSRLSKGSRVNLERSLRLGDTLGGHLVSGHVDAPGLILFIKKLPKGFARYRVSLPPALRGFAAYKGSIAIDGVSLTVTAVGRDWFETVLIPETMKRTTLGRVKPGDPVNLEADTIARYVRAALEARRKRR